MNTRISKSVAIAVATFALAAPFTSQANSSDTAMDACISAFVAANLPKEQPVRVQKEAAASSPLAVYSRGYKIIVTAKGMESGKYLARGTCTVDRDGQVTALNGKPLAEKLASR